ncbi:LIM/homeobox protein Lhx9 [Trichinella papuae]|uniref:LIM/homeobox protein Lhx9 n=1 Tax=Trichinella papuae TaxID=268474 RepID=A0A0V1N726_9BILA|nr:LIM/homeobox protein Lhx9 [Trichinella papuae]
MNSKELQALPATLLEAGWSQLVEMLPYTPDEKYSNVFDLWKLSDSERFTSESCCKLGEAKANVLQKMGPLGMELHCSGCQATITDQFYLLVAERSWHIHCLRCCVCRCSLETELTCFSRGDLIFCKEDYSKQGDLFSQQFSKRCSRCNRVVLPKDLVMRARDYVFHLHCFTCVVCNVPMQPGSLFGLGNNGLIYCNAHCGGGTWSANEHGSASPVTCQAGTSPFWSVSHSTEKPRSKGRPRRRKVTVEQLKPMSADSDCSAEKSSEENNRCHSSSGMQIMRPKRMRTSFKQQQLRTMKAYFQMNHNPDAKDLKQLAQKTGLTKRILQVWFQNARAKYRRSVTSHETIDQPVSPCKSRPNSSTSTTPEGKGSHQQSMTILEDLADQCSKRSLHLAFDKCANLESIGLSNGVC